MIIKKVKSSSSDTTTTTTTTTILVELSKYMHISDITRLID